MLALVIAAAAGTVVAQKTLTIWDGVFTAEQAMRGKRAYESACGYCHRDDLSGGGGDEPGAVPPPLVGADFLASWPGANLQQFVATVSATMPYQRPKLQAPIYRDITAYILSVNGAPAGSAELPESPEQLRQIRIVPQSR